ncbi:MAG TPA: TIGR02281 family clan AA aspartic protease [Xanthobacteraceae bacterium]
MQRLLWILLAVLGAILVWVAQKDEAFGGLSEVDYASLAVKVVLVVVIGSLALRLFRERFSTAVKSALMWVVIALILAIGYTYRFELQEVGDRVLAELVPGHVATRGHTVQVARSSSGGFSVAAQVNGARVTLALDTGASSVVLTQEAAKAAGLPLEVLTYTVTVDTANGRARAAPVTLDSLSVGGIVERSVPALVAQPGQLHTSLLGMSFLSRLESLEVHGDQLLMRGYP